MASTLLGLTGWKQHLPQARLDGALAPHVSLQGSRRWLAKPASFPALGVLKSTSLGIHQLGDPSRRPGQADALFPAEEKPCFQAQLQKAGEPRRSALAQEPRALARAPVLRYLGGITTIGWPRLGLHMRTWASLALGFTSALGGMGSILLRIRGCSC